MNGIDEIVRDIISIPLKAGIASPFGALTSAFFTAIGPLGFKILSCKACLYGFLAIPLVTIIPLDYILSYDHKYSNLVGPGSVVGYILGGVIFRGMFSLIINAIR